MPERIAVLGLPFFAGTVEQAVEATRGGGLVVAPAGPTMAEDYLRRPMYRDALRAADLVLTDSGAMVLFWNLFHGWRASRRLERVSGLRYLLALLHDREVQRSVTFWIMPSEKEGEANCRWLERMGFAPIAAEDLYVAPFYRAGAPISDPVLLAALERRRPRYVFVNIGGGTQEPLGAYLKAQLSFSPAIICTGAAIAFLSGQQAAIPPWADALYLGWLLRIFHAPRRFVPRYLKAARLIWLLGRYGGTYPG